MVAPTGFEPFETEELLRDLRAQRRSSRMGTCTRVADETRRAHHRQLRAPRSFEPGGVGEVTLRTLRVVHSRHAPSACCSFITPTPLQPRHSGSLVARRAAVPVPHRTKAR